MENKARREVQKRINQLQIKSQQCFRSVAVFQRLGYGDQAAAKLAQAKRFANMATKLSKTI